MPEMDSQGRSPVSAVQAILAAVVSQEQAIAELLLAEAAKTRIYLASAEALPEGQRAMRIENFQIDISRSVEALADMQRLLLRTVEGTQALLHDLVVTHE